MGVRIPNLCHHEGLSNLEDCRFCPVEVEGFDSLVAACSTTVTDGMSVLVTSPKVAEARRRLAALLLSRHPAECPICQVAGNCEFQEFICGVDIDVTEVEQTGHSLAISRHVALTDLIDFYPERCIGCLRCIRFEREVSHTELLEADKESSVMSVRPATRQDTPGGYSLCLTDICPAGALVRRTARTPPELTNDTFLPRCWQVSSAPAVCPECAQGCQVTVDHFDNQLVRLRLSRDPGKNRWWPCDHGRLALSQYQGPRFPMARLQSWELSERFQTVPEAVPVAVRELSDACSGDERLIVVISASSSLEEALAFLTLVQNGFNCHEVYLGSRPGGTDDGFRLRGDRNANSLGVKLLAKKLGILVLSPETMFADSTAISQKITFMVLGTDFEMPPIPPDASVTSAVVFAWRVDDISTRASVLLPVPAHFERTGLYVNHAGMISESNAVVTAPQGTVNVDVIISQMSRILGIGEPYSGSKELRCQALDAVTSMPEGANGKQ
jgi:NADH-quinone oxidoreductase subunit G